ncbi:glycosyltransferase family 90 protein [Pleomassaria siparia CBS 279.74]|uniref:Glycosyltransferase family 90 protein n=1 Tax=Pleomassaria siparia CBS 279.74 TaxID=1314801 RepID=A0A6G1K9V3_9PLEO|nr:glycosyltransferase family 90 protein [Pleomassaria siparia CBS 279.74]
MPSLTDVRKGILSGLGGSEEDRVPKNAIEHLMTNAEKTFRMLLKTQTQSLEESAARYRKKRGRHPPPGFDAWYHFASEKGTVMVEEFWDQIYHDLGPLWGVEAHKTRQQAHSLRTKMSIRNGVVKCAEGGHVRTQQWTDMLQALANYAHVQLPDVDIPVNINDEPAMLVPWEDVDTALSMARPLMLPPEEVVNEYSSLEHLDAQNATHMFDPEWLGARLMHSLGSTRTQGPRPFWSLVQPACPPHSPTRLAPIFDDIWHKDGHVSAEHSAASLLPSNLPKNTLGGYVKNWIIATDVCEYPNLQGLHGASVFPNSMSVTTKPFPLFGSSKMSMSNEILLPSPLDWNTSQYFGPPTLSWEQKQNKLYWRGPAIGGHNTENNWRRFHRHRFVSMLHATQVEVAEAQLHASNESTVGLAPSENFRLLPGNEYNLTTQLVAGLAPWVNGWADVEFTDLKCDRDWGRGKHGGCDYTGGYYSVAAESVDEKKNDTEAEVTYRYTAVLDGDGGDSDNELLSHLNAATVVLRASVYKQWYDARLIPWLHFVPMDNTFVDVYGIMEYFVGATSSSTAAGAFSRLEMEQGNGHDGKAEEISRAGMEWAQKVLRKEDMLVYVYRLVLEYARIADDRRIGLGWVDDLLG